jgi:hypothetical protein
MRTHMNTCSIGNLQFISLHLMHTGAMVDWHQ